MSPTTSSSSTPATSPASPRITHADTITLGKKYDFLRLHIETPAGKKQTRESVRHPGAVVIVPVLPDGRLVLIRVFRVSVAQWLYECCAGTLERRRNPDGTFAAGEDPAACAARELAEETGYSPAKLEKLAEFYTSPGLSDERMHAFLATGLTHVGQHLEEDEHIQVEIVSPAEALAKIDTGQIIDGKSITALLLAHRRGALGPVPAPK